jgi:hypothetical protein
MPTSSGWIPVIQILCCAQVWAHLKYRHKSSQLSLEIGAKLKSSLSHDLSFRDDGWRLRTSRMLHRRPAGAQKIDLMTDT